MQEKTLPTPKIRKGSAQISDNPEFNLGISGNASGVAGDLMIGLEGKLVGISADVHIAEIGGTVDITLWGVTISLWGEVMIELNGTKFGFDLGMGTGIQITWEKEEKWVVK